MLAQSLELFFSLIVRQAGLRHLEVKHRLAKKDVRPLLGAEGSSVEAVLLRWLNGALLAAQKRCEELLEEGGEDVGAQDGLILVLQQEELSNLDADLSDGVALAALYASIKARELRADMALGVEALREEKPFCEKELRRSQEGGYHNVV